MNNRVLIIGNNLAGLTAAFRLKTKGDLITVLQGIDQIDTLPAPLLRGNLGNKTGERYHHLQPDPCDLAPLVLKGTQDATSRLLKEIKQDENHKPSPRLTLEFMNSEGRLVSFRDVPLPSPLHMFFGILTFPGFSIRTRWSLLNYLEKLWEGVITLPGDLDYFTAEAWLTSIGQPQTFQNSIWNPLCRFLLNDNLSRTSASLFIDTLRRCFLSSSKHPYFSLFPSGCFQSLIQPLERHLSASGVRVQENTTATHILVDSNRVTGVRTQHGTTLTANWYVVALPAPKVPGLLPERLLAKFSYFHDLNKLRTTCFLATHFSISQPLSRSRLVLSNGDFHWILLQKDPTDPNHRASAWCISTGDPTLLLQSDQDLYQLANIEVRKLFLQNISKPRGPNSEYTILRQPSVSLAPLPGISSYRPSQQGPISNLFFAGDWTDTGLPIDTESAIVSGNICSNLIQERESTSSMSH